MSTTLYDVHVSRGKKVTVYFKNPVVIKPNRRRTQKTIIKMDMKFVLGKDILFLISYKEKQIDVFHFREANRYRPDGNRITPSMNNVMAMIGNSDFGYALLLYHNYLIGVYEVFCKFPAAIIKGRNKEIVKQVKPVRAFPMKAKGVRIDISLGMDEDRHLVFLDAEHGQRAQNGQRNLVLKRVRMYKENP
jgi:hypothetical protein